MTEQSILNQIAYHKRETDLLYSELREFRKNRAETIRDMYFKKRIKQSKIAEYFGMRQGSISRIISDITWA